VVPIKRNKNSGQLFSMSICDKLKGSSEDDIGASATLNLFIRKCSLFLDIIRTLDKELPLKRKRMLDLGCGYGGLSKLISDILGFNEVYGVDLDDQRLAIAKERGLFTFKCNLEEGPPPFPANYFELVTAFGVLEHLKFYDNLFSEAHRVLTPNGLFLISTPNLASWVNRIALLFGYQPRNLEVSKHVVTGVNKIYHSLYAKIQPVGHVSGATLKAIKGLLEFYDFAIIRSWGGGIVLSPDFKLNSVIGKIVRGLDSLISRYPPLSIRLFVLVKKKR